MADISQELTPNDAYANSIWNQFCLEDEFIIFTGLVSKKRGFRSQKRQLILTTLPRLLYVDPVKMVYKKDIAWDEVSAEQIDQAVFHIITPRRVYHFKALDTNAESWVSEVSRVDRIIQYTRATIRDQYLAEKTMRELSNPIQNPCAPTFANLQYVPEQQPQCAFPLPPNYRASIDQTLPQQQSHQPAHQESSTSSVSLATSSDGATPSSDRHDDVSAVQHQLHSHHLQAPPPSSTSTSSSTVHTVKDTHSSDSSDDEIHEDDSVPPPPPPLPQS